MGVKGLTSYFEEVYFETFQLQNTNLVIDGNSLLFQLYFDDLSVLERMGGGEYHKFYERVTSFFRTLKKCSVEPYVVFDGAVPKLKETTIIRRMQQKLKESEAVSDRDFEYSHHIPPPLTKNTMVQALNDLGIFIYQAAFEADRFVASLANYLSCPVLANDSDYYIFNLSDGYIPLKHLSRKVLYDCGEPFLWCRMYNAQVMVDEINPRGRVTVLPLLAVLLGNDYVPSTKFEGVVNRILARRNGDNFNLGSRARIDQLIEWLLSQPIWRSINVIVSNMRYNHGKMKNLINTRIEMYSTVSGEKVASLLKAAKQKTGLGNLPNSKSDLLPAWFCAKYRSASLPAFLYNVIHNWTHYLYPQLENHNFSSAYNICICLRRTLYEVLLLSDDSQDDYDRSVSEYERVDSELVKSPLPLGDCDNCIPYLEEIPLLDNFCRLEFYLGLEPGDLDRCPEQWKLLTGCLVYWLKHVDPQDPRVTVQHLESVILCAMFYTLVLPIYPSKNSANKALKRNHPGAYPDYSSFQGNMDRLLIPLWDLQIARLNLHSHYRTEGKGYQSYDMDVIHSFTQLQLCIFYASALNSLLCEPLKAVEGSKVYNGGFVYSLYCELVSCEDSDERVENLLGTSLLNIFRTWKKIVLDLIPDGRLDAGTRRRKQRNRGGRNRFRN